MVGRTANIMPHGINKKRTLPGKDHRTSLFLKPYVPQTIKAHTQ